MGSAQSRTGRTLVRRRVTALLRIVISLALLTWLLRQSGLEATFARLCAAEPAWLALALVLFGSGILLRAWRWGLLLRALDVDRPYWTLVRLYLVGTFFSKLLPGGVGGDIIRGVEVADEGADNATAAGTVIVDRLSGLVVLFLFCLITLPFGLDLVDAKLALLLAAVSLAGVSGAWLVWRRSWVEGAVRLWPGRLRFPWMSKLADLYAVIVRCGGHPFAGALGISVGVNLTVIGLNYTAARAVGIDLAPGLFLLFVPLISSSLLIPISWGGLGLREAVTVLLFSQVGVQEPRAMAMSLTVYLVSTLYSVLGGGIYLTMALANLRKGEEDDRDD